MRNRIPPPIVTALLGLLMWLVARNTPALNFGGAGIRMAVALALSLAGLTLMVAAIATFARARTTVDPLRPMRASSLVTHGVFARSRNPIYLANLLFLLAFALWLGNPLALLMSPVLVLYLNRFQIAPEEEALEKLFGDDFRRYRQQVRRWL